MNRYLIISFLGLGVLPWFWLSSLDEKIGFGYYHLTRAAFFSPPPARPDSIKTEKEYLAALHAADEKIFQDEFEAEFLLLLDKPQTLEYDSLTTLDARKSYIENYWKAANPNPLLRENDWLLDVLKRRAYARENFPAPEPPYFDDRGKYYFKYGKPSFRYWEGASGGTYANETWSYENITRDLLVSFVNDGKVFRAVENPLAIFESGRFLNLELHPGLWAALVKSRAAVSPVYGRARAKIHELETARRHAATFPKSRKMLAMELKMPESIIYATYIQAKNEILKAQSECPPAAHEKINAIDKLNFSGDLAQFRGAEGVTRVEATLLLPLEKNIVKSISRSVADTLRLTCSGLVSNKKFDGIARDDAVIQYPVKLIVNEKVSHAVGRLTFSASPQEGDVTLQIKDERNGKIGFTRRPLKIRDFRGQNLMLSDIQFLTEVANANQRKILPVFTKVNTAVAPYPFEKIRPSIPLLCYFEIYNLKTSGVAEQYEIIYKIVSEKGGNQDVAVSVSSTRAVSSDTAQELIGIDLRKVSKGRHRLEITVTATNNRNITAGIQKEIQIDD